MTAYYNEYDSYAAAWLRNLIDAGHIAPGDVDERSIKEVSADDLRGYDQCHFFAGIGGWSHALRLAGWPDDRSVWTGSCPCQPFSNAGKRKGFDDERHLWPDFHRLIAECNPSVVFGEQVASKDGRKWLAGVRSDLEGLGYGVGAADLCAASAGEKVKGRLDREDGSFTWQDIIIGAPHIRQRLWWVADSHRGQRDGLTDGERRQFDGSQAGRIESDCFAEPGGTDGGLADTERDPGKQGGAPDKPGGSDEAQGGGTYDESGRHRDSGGMDNPADPRRPGAGERGEVAEARDEAWMQQPSGSGAPDSGRLGHAMRKGCEGQSQRLLGASHQGDGCNFWTDSHFIPCLDGKARRTGSGVFPLAHGVPNRVGRLRAYGNAIVPQVAQTFIESYLECRI